MATYKLYEENSYLQQMTALVLRCEEYKNGYASVLDQTVFYPEGGGQPCDYGILDGQTVTAVFLRNDEVYHVTKEPLEAGREVYGHINWERRFDFMQQHTGEHIATGQALALYGANNVGFHLSENTVLLDVDKELNEDAVLKIEYAANTAIYENANVQASAPAEEQLAQMEFRSKMDRVHGAVRIVTVDKYDRCACCGTHVSSAGQIGMIKILDFQKHRGGTRMVLVAGRRALQNYSAQQQQVVQVSALLSAKPLEIAEAAKRLLQENDRLKQQLVSAKNEYIRMKIEALPISESGVCYFERGLTAADLRRIAVALMEKTNGICAVFTENESGLMYALGSNVQDMRAYALPFNRALSGRGGGQKNLVQGSIEADFSTARGYLKL